MGVRLPAAAGVPPAAGPTRVLGVDPGSHKLGWGVVERAGNRYSHLGSGTLVGRGNGFVARMCTIVAGLEDVLARFAPASCAVETAFTGKNMHSALVLGQSRGAVLVTLGRAGLTAVEYTPGQIKLATTGRGQAEKEQVQSMVRLLLRLGEQPLGLDASDALACALCHAQLATWRAPTPPAPQPRSTRRRPAPLPSLPGGSS